MKLKSLLVLILMLGTAYSQQPQVKYYEFPEEIKTVKPRHWYDWFGRHPAYAGLIFGGITGTAIGLSHKNYRCYSDAGTEGVYGTYTGTPSGQPGPHGCPLNQIAK